MTTTNDKPETLQSVLTNGNAKPRNSIPEGVERTRSPGRKGPKQAVKDETVIEYLRQGYSQADIARAVGLTDQAISKRVKRLGHRAVSALFHADSQLWGVELKTMAQLAELNSRLMNIATKREASTDEVVQTAREIRQQLDFQMRFQDALRVQQRFEEFRETVLRVLDEVGQALGVDLREKVMVEFKRKAESRLMLTRPRLAEGKGSEAHLVPRDEVADAEVIEDLGVTATVEEAARLIVFDEPSNSIEDVTNEEARSGAGRGAEEGEGEGDDDEDDLDDDLEEGAIESL